MIDIASYLTHKKLLDTFNNQLPEDLNHDGVISVQDCPYQPGTLASKLWVKKVLDPYVRAQATPEMKQLYGQDLKGMYGGYPLRDGANPGDGDYGYAVDRVILTQDVNLETAVKIVNKLIENKYGLTQ